MVGDRKREQCYGWVGVEGSAVLLTRCNSLLVEIGGIASRALSHLIICSKSNRPVCSVKSPRHCVWPLVEPLS
jgi:hypothetical protein